MRRRSLATPPDAGTGEPLQGRDDENDPFVVEAAAAVLRVLTDPEEWVRTVDKQSSAIAEYRRVYSGEPFRDLWEVVTKGTGR